MAIRYVVSALALSTGIYFTLEASHQAVQDALFEMSSAFAFYVLQRQSVTAEQFENLQKCKRSDIVDVETSGSTEFVPEGYYTSNGISAMRDANGTLTCWRSVSVNSSESPVITARIFVPIKNCWQCFRWLKTKYEAQREDQQK